MVEANMQELLAIPGFGEVKAKAWLKICNTKI